MRLRWDGPLLSWFFGWFGAREGRWGPGGGCETRGARQLTVVSAPLAPAAATVLVGLEKGQDK
jgi:hypothetical protein